MEVKDFLTKRKDELNQAAQKRKDKTLDDFIRIMNEFMTEWNDINFKMSEVDKQLQDSDKLNEPK